MSDRQEMAREAGMEAKELTILRARKMLHKALVRINQGLDAEIIKVFCSNGVLVESKPYTDHSTRLKAADMVITLNDAYPAERHEVNVTGNLAELIRDARERAKNRS